MKTNNTMLSVISQDGWEKESPQDALNAAAMVIQASPHPSDEDLPRTWECSLL